MHCFISTILYYNHNKYTCCSYFTKDKKFIQLHTHNKIINKQKTSFITQNNKTRFKTKIPESTTTIISFFIQKPNNHISYNLEHRSIYLDKKFKQTLHFLIIIKYFFTQV